jgi:hypothetical protein
MAGTAARPGIETEITREKLVEFLNEDLGREYQAIISYVVYSQLLKGAEYMSIAAELEKHAQQGSTTHSLFPNKLTILAGCLRFIPRTSALLRMRRKCCVSILRTRPKRSEITASGFPNARNWKNRQNTFAKS